MSLAIVVVDFQKDFFEKDFAGQERTPHVQESLLRNINKLVGIGRERKIPSIFIRTSYKSDRSNWTLRMRDRNYPICIAGTEGEKMIDGLDVRPEDYIVTKTRYSGFYKTDLESLLQSLSITTLAICGINTHACVKSTIVDAFMRDYRIFVPAECVNSYDLKQHENTLLYLSNRLVKIVSLHEMLERVNTGNYNFYFD